MSRTWYDNRCPTCKQRPKINAKGELLCGCGKSHVRVAGEKGTAEDAAILAAKGFKLAHSANGDTYYLGPGDCLVWLYANGTFWGSCGVENPGTFEEYLEEALKPLGLKM